MSGFELPLASDPAAVQAAIVDRLSGYVGAWTPAPGSRAMALIEIFARHASLLGLAARDLPMRYRLAFLDAMNVDLLSAQAARAPVVFTLTPACPTDVTVPAESQLAAQPTQAPPSLLSTSELSQPVVFFTEETVTAARAGLRALYSIDPGRDEYADHLAKAQRGFTLFDDMQPTEHALYLGHDRLFKLGGQGITLLLLCTLDSPSVAPLEVHWQYLSEVGWITLQQVPEEDTTRRFTRDGQVVLRLTRGPDAKSETFGGRTSYWIRGALNTPVIRGQSLRASPLTINDLQVRAQFSKSGLRPEAAFADAVSLDVSKPFYPFGRQPQTFDTFYVASDEVFQRAGATVQMEIAVAVAGYASADPAAAKVALVWEYATDGGWSDVGAGIVPTTTGKTDLTGTGTQIVSFDCPGDWAETEVNGVTNRWLRLRIASGNFGDPVKVTIAQNGSVSYGGGTLVAPVIEGISLSYSYVTDAAPLQYCVTSNDFVFEDQTDAAIWPDRKFDPFKLVSDEQPALHLGFDQPLPAGLVSIFVDAGGAGEVEPDGPSMVWEYWSDQGWLQLGVRDETSGLRYGGMLKFIGPPDSSPKLGMGGALHRIRARVTDRKAGLPRAVSGFWLNAVWAAQRARVESEPLGVSDGTPRQTFHFAQAPVLDGEVVEVCEWSGVGHGWRLVASGIDESDYRAERDPTTGSITALWVRWRDAARNRGFGKPGRFYVLERATGRLVVGSSGQVPPAGSAIVASYMWGGGVAGNVGPGAINQLRSALPFIASVANPVAAAGGTDVEAEASVSQRGAQELRHLDRAVTAADIEWIARDATPEVARARCLSLTGPVGHAQRGCVSVIVVPRTRELQPKPSTELKRRVAAYLRDRAFASAATQLRIIEPAYVAVSVVADVVPLEPDQAAAVESRIREQLDTFLHPLLGGSAGTGWNFGATLPISQVAATIESTPGVDYAIDIRLFVSGAERCGSVAAAADELLCAGTHEIKLTLPRR